LSQWRMGENPSTSFTYRHRSVSGQGIGFAKIHVLWELVTRDPDCPSENLALSHPRMSASSPHGHAYCLKVMVKLWCSIEDDISCRPKRRITAIIIGCHHRVNNVRREFGEPDITCRVMRTTRQGVKKVENENKWSVTLPQPRSFHYPVSDTQPHIFKILSLAHAYTMR
jgi:hypothetical protein